MVVRKLDDHPDYKPCYVLEVSQQLLSQIDEIREWLRCQSEHTTFYPPRPDWVLPGLLYFYCNAAESHCPLGRGWIAADEKIPCFSS